MTRGRAAWSISAVVVIAYVVGCILDPFTDPTAVATFGFSMLSFLLVGATITSRVPDNRIGPLFLLAGTIMAISSVSAAFGDIGLAQDPPWPGSIVALAITNVTFVYPIVIALIGVPLVFPDGRLPSPRFRWIVWVTVMAMVATALDDLFRTPFLGATNEPNPMRLESLQPLLDVVNAIASLSSVVGFGGAAAAVWVRYRHGTPIIRQQTKWLMAVAGIAAIVFPVSFLIPVISDLQALADAFFLAGALALVALPWAVMLAILRYRLYEIDRIVSRTISYAGVTVVLAATFGAVTLALGTLLSSVARGQSVAVAASTLVVFAIFQPIRRRVQRVVDQRFDRARYDGERTTLAFSDRLRNETDMTMVMSDLERTAHHTVAPSTLAIWLRDTRS